MSKVMSGIAVPFGKSTPIAEVGRDGKRRVYLERFDARSFAELPGKLPWVKDHRRSSPLGWAIPRRDVDGLRVRLEPIDSVAATDGVAEVKAGLLQGLSIAFLADEDADVWDAKDRRQLPVVTRRGARLFEVSLVGDPAYPGARIEHVDVERETHLASEAIMTPYREQRARATEQRRLADAELLRDLDNLEAVRWRESDPNPDPARINPPHPRTQQQHEKGGYFVQVGAVSLQVRGATSEEQADDLANRAWLAARERRDPDEYLRRHGVVLLTPLELLTR